MILYSAIPYSIAVLVQPNSKVSSRRGKEVSLEMIPGLTVRNCLGGGINLSHMPRLLVKGTQ
jgi:hypothetical protein